MKFKHQKYQLMLQLVFLMGIVLSAYPILAASNVKLSGAMPSFGDVIAFQISPDGRYALYLADQDTDQVFELYSVPIGDPAAPRIKLNGALAAGGGDVSSFQISPDSSRVVYSADQETVNVRELYSVPIGGPAASGRKLNGTLVPGGFVRNGFQISPDSSRVVYSADQETVNVRELYSVPIGGPAASGIKLNGALVAGRNVVNYRISPDSNRVVFGANQETVNVLELYSVPIGGPAASGIKVNSMLLAGWSLYDFQISPDSSRVVYLINQSTFQLFDLYSVPIKGPAASGLMLNSALDGNVQGFQISPDSSRVVYLAAQQTLLFNVRELYSVPIGGPAASGIKINSPLVTGGNVNFFEISLDSSRVVYQANQDTATVLELYSVPIKGPAASRTKLNGALVTGGNVGDIQISPDSGRVFYIADQNTVGVLELFMTSNYLLHLPLILRQG